MKAMHEFGLNQKKSRVFIEFTKMKGFKMLQALGLIEFTKKKGFQMLGTLGLKNASNHIERSSWRLTSEHS